MHKGNAQPLRAGFSRSLRGTVLVPSDKSISHRAIMLSCLAVGESVIENLLESEDVINTVKAMAGFGGAIERWADGSWHVQGQGLGGLQSPHVDIDFGNSGTGVRLVCGLAATSPVTARFIGDSSLSKRPMKRVIDPLSQMGAIFASDQGSGRLPLTLTGARNPVPISYKTPMPSAQVKSAVLLAGLNAPGTTTVIEAQATRDHTENMLTAFGLDVKREETAEGSLISVQGEHELIATNIKVPADPSSAAFPLVAALISPDAEIVLPDILLNPTRTGLIATLQEMGADIEIEQSANQNGETMGTLTVRSSELRGVSVPPERAPAMIDEYPILAVAAACAKGVTHMQGLGELRVKESDRLQAVLEGLRANGVKAEAGEDWLKVTGGQVPGNGQVKCHYDHRIAMAFLVLGLAAADPITIDDGRSIDTSFPGFVELMQTIGAEINWAPEMSK